MIKQPIRSREALLWSILSILLLIWGYDRLSTKQHIKNPLDRTIPTWSQMASGVNETVFKVDRMEGHRRFWADLKATSYRLFFGLFIGSFIGILVGLHMGCYPRIEKFLAPPIALFAQAPPTAIMAIFFVMVGTDTKMFVTTIAFGIVPPLAQAVYLGVKELPEELLYKSYTLGCSNSEAVWSVIFPYVWPKILDAIRLQFGSAIVFLIPAEMMVSDVGFGYRIRLESKKSNMDVVYPYIMFLMFSGFTWHLLLRYVQRLLCPWYLGLSFKDSLRHKLTTSANAIKRRTRRLLGYGATTSDVHGGQNV